MRRGGVWRGSGDPRALRGFVEVVVLVVLVVILVLVRGVGFVQERAGDECLEVIVIATADEEGHLPSRAYLFDDGQRGVLEVADGDGAPADRVAAGAGFAPRARNGVHHAEHVVRHTASFLIAHLRGGDG